jgi:hypothetical protein
VSPPSRPDERPGEADVLAAVRRLLPGEVDVVRLTADGPAGTRKARRTRAGSSLVAGALLLSGCSPSSEEIRAAAAAARADVVDTSRDVMDGLTLLGRPAWPVEGAWRSCGDLGGRLEYAVTGRLDPMPGDRARLAGRAVAELGSRGYRLAMVSDTRGVQTLQAQRGDVNVQLTGYDSDPFVLLDISGPCVEVAHLDRELRDHPPSPLP